jgi:hypothetical protein
MPATYLMSMPLRAITEVDAEHGPRDRFAQEIAGFTDAPRERLTAAHPSAS